MLIITSKASFMIGTLVWTDHGLVKIEQINVGDMVLSQPEGGGTREYKRVARTSRAESQRIYLARIWDAAGQRFGIFFTESHRFWISEKGWTSVDGFERGDVIELADGRDGCIWEVYAVSNTSKAGIGCIQDRDTGEDIFIDMLNLDNEWNCASTTGAIPRWDGEFKARVHNIEVEDFLTYYVGYVGLWAHCADGGLG